MINKTVILTNQFLDLVKTKINDSDELSTESIAKAIDLSEEEIKAVLRGEQKNLEIAKTVALYKLVTGSNDEEAVANIEKMLSQTSNSQVKVLTKDEIIELSTQENVQKIADGIGSELMKFFDFSHELAFLKLNDIFANVHFDLGFMVTLMSMDYTKFGPYGLEKRKEFLAGVQKLLEDMTK